MKKLFMSCALLMMLAVPAFAQITVSGEGTVSATPDMATVVLSVVTEDPQASAALETNSTTMSKLIKSLEALGVTKQELRTNQFHVSPKYVYVKDQEPRLVGYTVSNTLTVTVCQTDTFGKILDSAVKNGANRVDSVSWGFKNPQELLDKARVSAVTDAKRKAELMAKTAGSSLGTLVSIHESASYRPQYNMYAARAADAAPSVPVEAGTQTLRVTVNVVWNVGPPLK